MMRKEKLRFVIADDEPLIRMDLREMLEEAGHEVAGEASDGREAIALARRLHPACVLLDVKMPEIDGIAAARIITREKLAPVILLTAFSDDRTVERANAAGVSAYLVKPVEEAQLFPAIEIACARTRERRQMEAELAELKTALENRKLLDRAKGVLMDRCRLKEAEAFRRIQRRSMEERLPLEEVARAILRGEEKRENDYE